MDTDRALVLLLIKYSYVLLSSSYVGGFHGIRLANFG